MIRLGSWACVVTILVGCSQPKLSDLPQETPVSFTAAEPRVLATLAGCAASSCHGGNTDRPAGSKNAATLWAANDPHRQAYLELYTERGVEIVKRLGEWESTQSDQEYRQALSRRCTACHISVPQESSEHTIGVSCGGCHGQPEDWLQQHYLQGWRDATGKLSAPAGRTKFVDLRSLEMRAKVCVACHVGPKATDEGTWQQVDHDLLAAGHPRLDFEFSAYLANLPAHWNRQQDESRHAGQFHGDAWVCGQQAMTAISLPGTDNSPDFAHLACERCHHNLTANQQLNWRHAPRTATSADLLTPRRKQPAIELFLGLVAKQDKPTQRIDGLLQAVKSHPEPESWDHALLVLSAVEAWLSDQAPRDFTKVRAAADALRGKLEQCFPLPAEAETATLYDVPTEFRPSDIAHAWTTLIAAVQAAVAGETQP